VLLPQPRRRIRAPLCLAAALAFSLAALSAAAPAPAADLRAAADAPRAPTAAQSPNAAEPARRVVSLYPSLTAILLAIGAADALVGVDAFSAQQQSLSGIAQVGGLYNPSVERVLALRPDLVVAVPSVAQRGFLERLRDLNAPLLELNPVSFEDVAASVETLGRRVGRSGAAGARANALRRARRRAEALTRGRPPVPMLFVVERDPVFVAGPGSFLDDMLRAAGARNLAASFKTPWPRVSREWLIAAAPELLLDSSPDPQPAARWWARCCWGRGSANTPRGACCPFRAAICRWPRWGCSCCGSAGSASTPAAPSPPTATPAWRCWSRTSARRRRR